MDGFDTTLLHNARPVPNGTTLVLQNGDRLEVEISQISDSEPEDEHMKDSADQGDEDGTSLIQHSRPSSAPGLTKTHLAGLHLPLAVVLVDTEVPMLDNVIDFWPYSQHPTTGVIAFHPVGDPPTFAHAEQLPMFIVQRSDDRFEQEMENDVLAVVTVSVQAPHAAQPRSQRFKILWLPAKGTRANYIDFFRMTGHCRKANTICFLYLNNIIWPETDTALRSVEFGDHMRLQVRSEQTSWCDYEYTEGISRGRRLFASSSPEREVPPAEDGDHEEEEEEPSPLQITPSDLNMRVLAQEAEAGAVVEAEVILTLPL